MKKILVWKGKHSDYYYDATTDEDLANASLDIIRTWMDEYHQYIRPGADPLDPEYVGQSWNKDWAETVEWSKKELAEVSEATQLYNDKVSKAKQKVAKRIATFESENVDYREAKKLVDEWDTSLVQPPPYRYSDGRVVDRKPYVKAWHFLQAYVGGEYQDVRMEDLTTFEEDDD